jgi:hypothetical protein
MAEIIGANRQQKSSEGAVRVPQVVKRSDKSTRQQKKTSSHAETREDVRERFAGRVQATNRLHKSEKSYLVPGVPAGAAVVAACWSRLSEYFFPEKKTLVNDFEPSSSLLVE